MQDYCGEAKNDEVLEAGLRWLNSMRESELSQACARNPHELARTLEALSQATMNEIIIQATLAHKASSRLLDLKAPGLSGDGPAEWRNYMTIRKDNAR